MQIRSGQGKRSFGARRSVAVSILSTLVLAGCGGGPVGDPAGSQNPSENASLACSAQLTEEQQIAWDAALALHTVGRGADARAAALAALTASGALPADDPTTGLDECVAARGLIAPDLSRIDGLRETVTTWLETWWMWLALALALVSMLLTRVAQWPSWRRTRMFPGVRVSTLVLDGAAAPKDVGAELGGRIRVRLAAADKANPLPSLRLADPADVKLQTLPLDPIPEQASWLVKLGGWLSGLNTMTPHVLLSEPDLRDRTVSCAVRIDDRRGRTVRRAPGAHEGPGNVPCEELIVIPIAGATAEPHDYHGLAEFVAIWLQLEVCRIQGREEECRLRLGTDRWDKYNHFLLGRLADRRGEDQHARQHYEDASAVGFHETTLNRHVVNGSVPLNLGDGTAAEVRTQWSDAAQELKKLHDIIRSDLDAERSPAAKQRLRGLLLRSALNAAVIRLNVITAEWLGGLGKPGVTEVRALEALLTDLRSAIDEVGEKTPLGSGAANYDKVLAIALDELRFALVPGSPRPLDEAGLTTKLDAVELAIESLTPLQRRRGYFGLACVLGRRHAWVGRSRRRAIVSSAIAYLDKAIAIDPATARYVRTEPAFARLVKDRHFRDWLAAAERRAAKEDRKPHSIRIEWQ